MNISSCTKVFINDDDDVLFFNSCHDQEIRENNNMDVVSHHEITNVATSGEKTLVLILMLFLGGSYAYA